ncbi:MAG TPA: asparagine synthase (glutamine-hydrolyzing) [Thermoflexia bacterium]|nr:asparagine synthase (glutamine-hydrolyzing) [Thermoflexia bacterium]
MCGIVGAVDWTGERPPEVDLLRRMLSVIRHRGPDEFGVYVDQNVGIGCARLSIVDLSTGSQPIPNEDRSLWIVFNGEVYNHPELREELERKGHRFSTRSDTEVILHLYEDLGPDCLHRLNGQFAIAIWDVRREELFLARDRLGIRPLFYTLLPEGMVFGSEIKALLLDPRVEARLDPYALAQAFTFWAPLAPRTVFQGIRELPPGHYMRVRADSHTVTRYWGLSFPEAGHEDPMGMEEAAARLRDLLADATRLRLRADVPVGSYLSGGLDSTLIAALIRHHVPDTLCTFSIAFQEAAFDERPYQEIATAFLRTAHRRTECTNADIGTVFPEVVWHAEAPLLRTSPAPMFLLSRLVHESGIKVVLTGEGADEFLGGYNIFKEDKVRRFWARQPDSAWRPLLLHRLYPYVADLSRGGDAFLRAFFRRGLTEVDQPGYSHLIRWRNTRSLHRLFSAALREALGEYDPVGEFLSTLDGLLPRWSPLAQAQYLEVATFMSPYLLSSQGDRMMAANSVEGRFPFLDHRVVEFAARLPSHLKIRGLQEKYILRKSAQGLLPPEVWQRRKQPYRAPIHPAFFDPPPDYVEAMLSPESIREAGLFDPEAVAQLVRKCRSGRRVGERDDMALVGVLSTQLLHHLFVANFPPGPVGEADPVRVHVGPGRREPLREMVAGP